MAAPHPPVLQLSEPDRRLLESWLYEFGRTWAPDRLVAQARALPADHPLRRPALVEMIKIDLERRWQSGRRVAVEAYLKLLPELGPPDTLPADLIQTEYEVRRQFGAPADLTDFTRRFPNQAGELRRLVEQAR